MKGKIILDDIDLEIIRRLRENSKITYKELAEEMELSIGAMHSRIKRLENKGVIKGYTINVDHSKLGYDITAIIMMQVEGPYIVEVEKILANNPDIMSIYDITGEFDIAVIAKLKDREHLNKLIKGILTIPHVKRTVTSIALSVVKENFM
ncbi:MAG: Lrp/AsnC family transcriptional regulator [Candidatus Methanomethylicia archaeon]|nr:Lrp/AsnC family transcriptional regulator [Candidatus Methanomethylicia archaeon]MDW7988499.1 Lrp/AsnC family transcriptional regulator [Nitrososphaerota archaeon]